MTHEETIKFLRSYIGLLSERATLIYVRVGCEAKHLTPSADEDALLMLTQEGASLELHCTLNSRFHLCTCPPPKRALRARDCTAQLVDSAANATLARFASKVFGIPLPYMS